MATAGPPGPYVLMAYRIGAYCRNEGEGRIFEAEDPEVVPVVYGPNSTYPKLPSTSVYAGVHTGSSSGALPWNARRSARRSKGRVSETMILLIANTLINNG